jgi:hypothetical protein
MLRTRCHAFFVILILAAAGAAAGTLEADLELMLSWFEGEFDNHLQFLADQEDPPEQPHEWIHSIFTRVELPAFGEHVFYVEQYTDGDPTKIYRNRIYTFVADDENEAIKLAIYSFADPAAFAGAHLEPAKLEGLTPGQLRTVPGCEVFWRRDGETRFIGYMEDGACRVDSPRLGTTIIIDDDLVLTPDEIWIGDRATDVEGNWVFGNRAGIQHKLKRARLFDCWAAVRNGSDGEWSLERGLRLHDQGGRAAISTLGDSPRSFRLELEQRVYEGGGEVPVLKIALYEDGVEESLAYSWTDTDADRIGMNLRWAQGGCTAR